MGTVELVLGLIAACLGFALLARHLQLPDAVILVVGGMALAFVPGLPEVRLDPDLALAFFLPPLLQSSAYRSDWRAFRQAVGPILMLAIGAVIFTALVVGATAHALVPGLPWPAAIALGAIVAPPDAVAAGAVLQRLRLPRRIVTVLEGESLINDASALVLYRFAVGAVAIGGFRGFPVFTFVLLGAGGIAVGWAVAEAAIWAMRRLDDTLLEITTSFLCCYASYLAGEALHVSGVLAVVTSGAVLGGQQHRMLSPRTRQEARVVWQFVEFILNSLVFILIGLQLHSIVARLDGSGVAIAGIAGVVSLVLILSRFAWIFSTTYLVRLIPRVQRIEGPAPSWRYLTVLSWAGMRGVVSLAVALALPLDFPERDLIVFIAFCAILATLVVQGTTLEWVIRRLRVELPAPPAGIEPEEAEARRLAAQAALEVIEEQMGDPLEGAIAADLAPEFRGRAEHLHRVATTPAGATAERAARRRL
ncbi:MAG TPA: Na+/H+ antiporter, partial [Crenalkalicoccus sp.]|nr:Na+/H+ antiporter [Crenalkalicoccus sp.]